MFVSVTFLETHVLALVVQVVAALDDGPGHLCRYDDAANDTDTEALPVKGHFLSTYVHSIASLGFRGRELSVGTSGSSSGRPSRLARRLSGSGSFLVHNIRHGSGRAWAE
jgi:hypothetical protein